jgi:hypothetical protein
VDNKRKMYCGLITWCKRQPLTAPKFHFLRVSAQMCNLTKQKMEI